MTVATAALVAPWGVHSVVRVFGLEAGFPLVPAIAFTPYAAATAVVPLAFALLVRRWWVALAAAVTVAALGACVVPRVIAHSAPSTADGPTLRVLTINMYYGQADPDAIADLVRERNVDVLGVQEVTSQALDALARAGVRDALRHEVSGTAPAAAGGAVLSRYPLEPVRGKHPQQWTTDIAVPGAVPVRFASVHAKAPYSPGQVEGWEESLARIPRATPKGRVRVVAGDLNATLDHASLRSLLDSGYTDAAAADGSGWRATWPIGRPSPGLAIDHVLVDRRVGVTATSVHDIPGTDHRAFLSSLTLPAK